MVETEVSVWFLRFVGSWVVSEGEWCLRWELCLLRGGIMRRLALSTNMWLILPLHLYKVLCTFIFTILSGLMVKYTNLLHSK